MVAEAFIPNVDNKPTVNHKDENKLNNSVDNLEWMTVMENNHHGTHYQRSGAKQKGKTVSAETRQKLSDANKGKKLTDEQRAKMSASRTGAKHCKARSVRCIETQDIFFCISDAAREYHIDKSLIVANCKGKRSYAGKHPTTGEKLHWEYYEIF